MPPNLSLQTDRSEATAELSVRPHKRKPPLSAGLTQHRMASGCSSESLDDSDRLFASASISLQFMRSKKWVRMTYWTKTSRMSYSEAESSNEKLTVRLESENTFSRGQTLRVNP